MTNSILDSGQKIVTDGLVLNYDVAQLRSYPTTGTVLTDLSGNNNNGTLVNGVGFNSGNGGSLSFDGVNDYVDLGLSTINNLINGANASSFSCWFKNSTLPSTGIEGNVILMNAIESNSGLILDFIGSTIQVGGRSTITDTFKSATTPFTSTNIWVNVCAIFDYTNKLIYIYINGFLVKTQSAAFNSNIYIKGNPTIYRDKIGSSISNLFFFNGNVSQIQIYNKALSSTEVLQNFNANRSRYGL